jgi:hypothetical protein
MDHLQRRPCNVVKEKRRGTPPNLAPPPSPAHHALEVPLVPMADTIAAPHRLKPSLMPTRTGRNCCRLRRRTRRPARVVIVAARTVPHLPRPRPLTPAAATAARVVHHRLSPPDTEHEPTHTRAPWPCSHQIRVRWGHIREYPPPLAMETPATASFRKGVRRLRPPHPARAREKRPHYRHPWTPRGLKRPLGWRRDSAGRRKSKVVALGFGAARSPRRGDASGRPFFFAILFLSRGSVGRWIGWGPPVGARGRGYAGRTRFCLAMLPLRIF